MKLAVPRHDLELVFSGWHWRASGQPPGADQPWRFAELSALCHLSREHVRQSAGQDARKQTKDGQGLSIASMPGGRVDHPGRARTAQAIVTYQRRRTRR